MIYLDVGFKVCIKTAHLGCSTRVFHFGRQRAKKIIKHRFQFISHTLTPLIGWDSLIMCCQEFEQPLASSSLSAGVAAFDATLLSHCCS